MASAWCMALAAHPLGRLVESPEEGRPKISSRTARDVVVDARFTSTF